MNCFNPLHVQNCSKTNSETLTIFDSLTNSSYFFHLFPVGKFGAARGSQAAAQELVAERRRTGHCLE